MAISTAAAEALTNKKKFEEEQILFLSSILTYKPNLILRRLAEGIVDINKGYIAGTDLDPALIGAILIQNQFAFDELIKQDRINLQVACSMGVPAVLYAVDSGNIIMTRAFLERGVDPNTFAFASAPERALCSMKAYSLIKYGQWPIALKSIVEKWYNQEDTFKPEKATGPGKPFPTQTELPRIKYEGNLPMLTYLFSKKCAIDMLNPEALSPYEIAMNPFAYCQGQYLGIFSGDSIKDIPKIVEVKPSENTIVFQINMENRNNSATLPILVEYNFTKVQKLFQSYKAQLDKEDAKKDDARQKQLIQQIADAEARMQRASEENCQRMKRLEDSALKMHNAEMTAIRIQVTNVAATAADAKAAAAASAEAAQRLKENMLKQKSDLVKVASDVEQAKGAAAQAVAISSHAIVLSQRNAAAINQLFTEIQPVVQSNSDKAKVEAMRLHPTKKNFHTQLHVASAAFLAACEALSSDKIQRNENTAADYVAKGFKLVGDVLPLGGFIAKGIGAVIALISDKMELAEKRRIALILEAQKDAISKGMAVVLTERSQNALQIIDPADAEELTGQAIELIGRTLISKDFYKKATEVHRTIDEQQAFIVNSLADAVERSPNFQKLLKKKIDKALEKRFNAVKKQPALETFFTEISNRLLEVHKQLQLGLDDPKKSAEAISALTPLLPGFPKNPSLETLFGMFITQAGAKSKLSALPLCIKSIALSITEKVQAQLLMEPKQAKEKAKTLADSLATACFIGLFNADSSAIEQSIVTTVQQTLVQPAPVLMTPQKPTQPATPLAATKSAPASAKPSATYQPAAAAANNAGAPIQMLHGYVMANAGTYPKGPNANPNLVATAASKLAQVF